MSLAVVPGVFIAASVVHHFQLKWATERFKAELKARGELKELAQVVTPRIPPERNSAAQFLAAVDLFATNENVLTTNWPIGMRGVAPGKAQVLWRQNFIRD